MPAASTAPLVLVADNDRAVSRLLCEVLGRVGLRAACVSDGASALRYLAEREVALLVCDLDMPGLGGRDVLRRLGPGGPPAVVVSGFLDAAAEAELAALHEVRATFRKPFDIFAFAEAARQLAWAGAHRQAAPP
jgi:CheY-like chemotaxis protein